MVDFFPPEVQPRTGYLAVEKSPLMMIYFLYNELILNKELIILCKTEVVKAIIPDRGSDT